MTPIEAPIVSVTVLEDRAQITRRAMVRLEAGTARLRLEGVAPVVSDRTVVARIEGAEVVDARVERRRLDREEADREITTLERELELGELEETTLDRERARLGERLGQLKTLLALRLDDAAEDAAWGREPDSLATDLATLREQARTTLAAALDLDRRLGRHREHLGRLRRRLRSVSSRPRHDVGAALVLDVKVERSGETELIVDYVVGAAAWRPYHRAVVSDALVLETDGCIWQNTGEDWIDVAVVLSTERRSLGVEAPELATDELRIRRRQAMVQVETREQRVEKASVEGNLAPDLPGIDDGGEAMALRAADRATVPSDGRPHRIRLGRLEAPADLELVAHPELDSMIHWIARLSNHSTRPLLAGPVDVIREGGSFGRTRLDYVGPGERFELGLGPEPDLRLRRDTELEVDDARLLSSWTRTHHRVTVHLSNLGRRARRLEIRERIPVSEIEQVKVAFRKATGGAVPDRDGFLELTCEIGPRSTARLELSYQVDKHDSVVGL